MDWEDMDLFGASIPVKWFITYEVNGVMFYLASSDDTARLLTWSQRQEKSLKFDSSSDAEKVVTLIKSHRKNKKLNFKVK